MEQSQIFWSIFYHWTMPIYTKHKKQTAIKQMRPGKNFQGQAWKESMEESPHEMHHTESTVGLWRQLHAGQTV